MQSIESVFIQEGYRIIPFKFNGLGHPTIDLKIKNATLTFLLDTGAVSNLLDIEYAKKLNLSAIPTGQRSGGVGGIANEIFVMNNIDLQYDDIAFHFDQFYAMSFDTIKQTLKSKGVTEEFQGILGFGFFKMTHCFIDYDRNRLFIKY